MHLAVKIILEWVALIYLDIISFLDVDRMKFFILDKFSDSYIF